MAKFEFRLQRVLEYRELQEGWAKDAYIEARAVRLEAEAAIEAINTRRKSILGEKPGSLDDHRILERYLQQLDDEERTQRHIIQILETEEATALAAWQERKRDLEAFVKLREKALEEFKLEETRREQAELDEWTTTRRTA
jgi:flagellar export protein FliJ